MRHPAKASDRDSDSSSQNDAPWGLVGLGDDAPLGLAGLGRGKPLGSWGSVGGEIHHDGGAVMNGTREVGESGERRSGFGGGLGFGFGFGCEEPLEFGTTAVEPIGGDEPEGDVEDVGEEIEDIAAE